MKALFLHEIGNIGIIDQELTPLSEGFVRVKMKAAALNRRDQWIREGKYPKIVPSILGSDGCGIVVEVQDPKDSHWIGKEVVMNPNNLWGDSEEHQSMDYYILGMPKAGTFAEYLDIASDRIHLKPEHLSSEEAAALPLAALTAYRSVFYHGNVTKEKRVLVTGIGGGVAQFALQFALAEGAEVYATTGDENKAAYVKDLGAAGVVSYKDPNWRKELSAVGAFDVVIDSGGGESFAESIKLLGRSGRLVFYGATTGLPEKIDLYRMFFNQIRIQGSTMGSDKEFAEMIQYVEKHKIVPLVSSVHSFENAIDAFDEMKASKQFGKIILRF